MNRSRCSHEGRLLECAFEGSSEVSALIAAVEQGGQLFIRGVCADCGNLVEREYGAVRTLPALEATLKASCRIASGDEILPWTADEHEGIPAHIYIVHPGEGLKGVCGLRGMAFIGIHSPTKQFVYECHCGFQWQVCAQDLGQMIGRGLHRSFAARRAMFSHPAVAD